MKKIINYSLMIFLFIFIGMIKVDAANASLTLSPSSKTIKKGDSINISAELKDYSGDKFDVVLDYSSCSKILEKRTSTLPANQATFTVTGNGKISDVSFVAKENGTCTITLTSSKSTVVDASATIVVADSTTTTTTKSTTTTTTTTKSTTTTTTTSAVKSNNSNLKTLKITDNTGKEVSYSPDFSATVYEYNATVASEIETVSVDVTMEDEKANVIITNNNKTLVAGENNEITITVTAEDGTKRAYVVNIKREALDGNAALATLTIEECPDFKLEENKFSYTVKVDSSVEKLTLGYSVLSASSTVEISDNSNLKDGSKVKILVRAEDGSKREYTLVISKEKEEKKKTQNFSSERNPIIIMALSIIGFAIIGAIIHIIRKK